MCTVGAHMDMGGEFISWRRSVLDEPWQLRWSFQDEQRDWFAGLRPHLQHLYGSATACRQVPLMRHIAGILGYPFEHLEQSFTFAFPMLEAIPTEGMWTNLVAQRSAAMSVEELVAFAKQHLVDLVQRQPCKHWQQLREKLHQEVREGKVIGPLQPPPDFPLEFVHFLAPPVGAPDEPQMVSFPYGEQYAVALHFDVV